MNADFEDDGPPPDLVDTSTLPAPESAKSESTRLEEEPEQRARVPITLVTGYLGAGKTTLLNYILTEKHGKKIAVIMNEFGDTTDIEKPLTVNQAGQEVTEWMEVGNGCICCSVKDSGVMAIESLMDRRGTFDYILLETTGLADPGNIAPIFWVDDNLGSSIYLDGIVTLVDAKNILRLLDEPAPEERVAGREQEQEGQHQGGSEDAGYQHQHKIEHGHEHEHEHGHKHEGPILSMAHMQISHADVVILNKADLVSSDELQAVRDRITAINSAAKVHITHHGQTPQIEGVVLDLHAYDNLGKLEVEEDFGGKGHSHIDPAISTIKITNPPIPPEKLPRVDAWLRSVLWECTIPSPSQGPSQSAPQSQPEQTHPIPIPTPKDNDFEIHRLKGILKLEDGSIKIIQAVRDIFEIRDVDVDANAAAAASSDVAECKIALIGRGLGRSWLPWQRSFGGFLEGNC